MASPTGTRAEKLAVFVDGCFWHGCPRHATKLANNRAFWWRKFAVNKARDPLVNRALRGAGWRVLRVWERELARKKRGAVAPADWCCPYSAPRFS